LLRVANNLQAQEIGGGWTTSYDFLGAPDEHLGNAIAITGDINGDGCDDFLVGAENASTNGAIWGGKASLYSGADGTVLYSYIGPANNAQFGHSLTGLGDVNGDGIRDFAISADRASNSFPQSGSVYVYSGATGLQLHRFDGTASFMGLGSAVSSVGDLDGDGFQDVMACSEIGELGTGTIYIWSCVSGALLRTIHGPQTGMHFGRALAGPGDVSGDGIPDILVGAPLATSAALPAHGSAMIYSGADGSLYWQADGTIRREHFGTAVDGAGDLDGDGCNDFVIGGPGLGPVFDLDYGGVSVYSGQLGNLLFHLDGAEAFSQLGSGVAGIGDFDGDGIGDLALGAEVRSPMGMFRAGSIAIHSGADGGLLYTFSGETPLDRIGTHIDGGDFNHDGLADLAFASERANPNWHLDSGAAYVRGGFTPYLTSSSSELHAATGDVIQFDIDFPSDAANGLFYLVASDQGTPSIFNGVVVPLDASTTIWNQMLHAPPPVFSNPSGLLDNNGDATCVLSAPPNVFNFLVGSTVRFAALFVDSTTYNRYSSAAVTLKVVL
jgi:hypothetical protein